ncbi:MAG: type II secretion system F family protein [candidate division WOR-3 bacterium]
MTIIAAEAGARYRRRFLVRTEEKVESLYLGVSPERIWLSALFGALAGATLLGLLTSFTPVPVLLGAIGGFLIPRFYLRRTEQIRRRRFDAQLLTAIPMIAGAMKAGMSLLQAIEQVTREMPPPIKQEFAHMLHENRIGRPLKEALQDMRDRIRSEDLNITVNAINIALETGGVLSEVLVNIVDTIRARNRIRARIDALSAQGRLQGIVMSLMPWALAAVLFALDREMIRPMFATAQGQMILVAVAVLELLGWLVIRRLIAIDV